MREGDVCTLIQSTFATAVDKLVRRCPNSYLLVWQGNLIHGRRSQPQPKHLHVPAVSYDYAGGRESAVLQQTSQQLRNCRDVPNYPNIDNRGRTSTITSAASPAPSETCRGIVFFDTMTNITVAFGRHCERCAPVCASSNSNVTETALLRVKKIEIDGMYFPAASGTQGA